MYIIDFIKLVFAYSKIYLLEVWTLGPSLAGTWKHAIDFDSLRHKQCYNKSRFVNVNNAINRCKQSLMSHNTMSLNYVTQKLTHRWNSILAYKLYSHVLQYRFISMVDRSEISLCQGIHSSSIMFNMA